MKANEFPTIVVGNTPKRESQIGEPADSGTSLHAPISGKRSDTAGEDLYGLLTEQMNGLAAASHTIRAETITLLDKIRALK